MYASGFEIEQSLRFDDNLSQILERIPTEASNRRTFTQSVWFKLGNIGSSVRIFTAQDGSGTPFYTIDVFQDAVTDFRGIRVNSSANSDELMLITNGRLRDVAAWYHLVVAVDTTQGTNTNRCKIYLNGTQLTDLATATYPDQNYDTPCNNTVKHNVGAKGDVGGPFDGYMAEFHHIDGTALTPASFGETGDYGEWKPIKYVGSHGTNGFYLPFKHDYSVEGFSTSTYRGSGVSGKLVNGVGFQPDFTWIKPRSTADNHVLYDSVRGYKKQLKLNATDAEDTNNRVETKTDGFKLTTTDGNQNSASHTYVAWNWDMGSPKPKQFYIAGNTHLDTGQKKFGASSLQFDGTGDYVTSPNVNGADEDWNFLKSTSSTATVECFVRHSDSIGGDRVYISATEGAYSNSWYLRAVNGGEVNFTAWDNGATTHSVRTGAGVVSQNTWHHVALVKNGTNFKIFIDGTDETDSGGTDTSTNSSEISELRIGDNGSGQLMVGYIDEIRISDTARYSSNFTPTGSAFSTDSNTKLLMHMDGPNNGLDLFDSAGIAVNTTGTIASNVKANTTYGQSVMSWIGTGATGTVGTGLSSDAEVVIVKGRTTTDNWSISTTVIDGSVDGTYINGTGVLEDWSSRVDPSSSTSGAIGVYNWDDGNKADTPMIAYAFHSVTGYSKIDKYTGNGSSTGPTVTTGFKVGWVMIKQNANGDHWHIYDNMRSADGPGNDYLTANRNNAEAENHSQEIDFLDTGFQLKSSNTGTNGDGSVYFYMAFADNREYHIGIDQSGNNNDWATEGSTENTRVLDTPSNNFAVFNPAEAVNTSLADVVSQGNLMIQSRVGGSGDGITRSSLILPTTGKWYAEYLNRQGGNGDNAILIGIADASHNNYRQARHVGYYLTGNNGNKYTVTTSATTDNGAWASNTWNGGSIFGVAYDADNGTLTFYLNGELQGGGAAFSSISGQYYFATGTIGGSESFTIANFGQDSTFSGYKSGRGNTDANGLGDFFYPPPANHLALCTQNLSEPSIKPREYFNTTIWTGNNTDDRNITGIGFAPDFVWIKSRNRTDDNLLFNKLTGVGNYLRSNATDGTTSNANTLQSFDSDGFQIGNDSRLNTNNDLVVSWNWRANGSGSQNTEGSLNTTATSANTAAGFSIITYSGNGVSGATIGHGLSSAPEFMTVKRRSSGGDDWNTYHAYMASDPETDFLRINSNAVPSDNSAMWNDTAPSSTLITLGNHAEVNSDGETYVCYAWHSVEGYSKFGIYTGNGNTDGAFVHTGFRPGMIIYKRVSATEDWYIRDSVRDATNPGGNSLSPTSEGTTSNNCGSSGNTCIDYLSNGFKLRGTDTQSNDNTSTYIYMAWADVPFKYANAR